jgi:hypothetical protein
MFSEPLPRNGRGLHSRRLATGLSATLRLRISMKIIPIGIQSYA